MSEHSYSGVTRCGLGAAFEADEARKSSLILEAQRLRQQGQDEGAAARFAEAAGIEEGLADRCEERSLVEKAFIHRFRFFVRMMFCWLGLCKASRSWPRR